MKPVSMRQTSPTDLPCKPDATSSGPLHSKPIRIGLQETTAVLHPPNRLTTLKLAESQPTSRATHLQPLIIPLRLHLFHPTTLPRTAAPLSSPRDRNPKDWLKGFQTTSSLGTQLVAKDKRTSSPGPALLESVRVHHRTIHLRKVSMLPAVTPLCWILLCHIPALEGTIEPRHMRPLMEETFKRRLMFLMTLAILVYRVAARCDMWELHFGGL